MSAGAPLKWLRGKSAAARCAAAGLIFLGGAGATRAQEPAADPPPGQSASPEANPGAGQSPAPAPAPATEAQGGDAGAAPGAAGVKTIPVAVKEEQPQPAPPETTRLDEVQVTAQKRGNQAIKDVPISISVVNDEMIFDWGLTNVREVMLFVPNVKVEEAGYFMLPRIRGFSTNNNNKAFEPPAGIAIDGIPYGRVEYFNAGLFDISRVEVLRGPQGTTFGKNTTAGLIHILTKDPTEEFKGFVDLQRGDYDRERIEFGLGGEVIEGFLNARVSGMTDKRRGFVFNTTHVLSPQAGEFLQGKDNGGFRTKLQFPDLLGSTFKLTYEKLKLGSLGSGIEIIDVTDTMAATLKKYDPNVDLVGGNQITSLDYPDERRTEILTTNGEWGYALGSWNLAAIGGQSVMKTKFFLDTDFSPAPAILGTGEDRSPTRTLELRALSPSLDGLFGLGELFGLGLGDSDILIGGFLQRNAIENGFFDFAFPVIAFADVTAAAEGSGNTDSDPPLAPDILGFVPPNAIFLQPGVVDDVRQYFTQHSKVHALFTQLQWRFVPGWAVQVGARYSQEKKDAQWNSVFTSPPPNAVVTAAGIQQFVAERNRQDNFFQPKVSLNYQPTESLSVFLHWARSFKSGGYNAFAFRAVDDQLQFQPEYTREWGLDVKGMFFDRTVQLNLSGYLMNVRDFQVLTRVPTAGVVGLGLTKVINAPAARAQGLEGDATWLVASWLRLFATLGINDTKYLDFRYNECAPDHDDTDGDGDPRCDATGKAFPFAPKYNGTISAGFTPPISFHGIDLNAGVSGEYASWQHTDIDLDPRKIQKAYWRLRASVGFGNPGSGWSFKLIGENLTNVLSYIRRGDLAPKQFVGIAEPPRQIYGQFRWTF